MEYRHVQWGYLAIPTLVLFAAVAFWVASDDETTVFSLTLVLLSVVGIQIIVMIFSRLDVTVGNGRIVAAFGFGRPRRVVELERVVSVRQVRNSWLQGWGIRKVPNGWMYNVWGLDAVELELDSGAVFRIGSDDAENLATAISLQPKG